MARGSRVLDQGYIFRGKHYLPGPGGVGVVDLNGNEVELPKDFPKERLEAIGKRMERMDNLPVHDFFQRVPSADSEAADGHAGVQPMDVPNPAFDEDGGEEEVEEDGVKVVRKKTKKRR